MTRSTTWWLVGIVALAAVVRLVHLVAWTYGDELFGDAIVYHGQANYLADGKPYIDPWAYQLIGEERPQADHPPAFVAYLAAFSLVGLDSANAHIVASALLGLPLVVLVFLLARTLAGDRAAVLAGVVAALDPNLFTWEGLVLSEPLAASLTTLAVWQAYRAVQNTTALQVAGAIAAATLAGLARAEMMLLVVVFALVLLPRLHRAEPQALRRGIAYSVAALVVLLGPWALFNTLRYDRVVIVSNGLGRAMASAACDQTFTGNFEGLFDYQCLRPVSDAHPVATDGELDPLYLDHALTYLSNHKSQVPRVAAVRLARTFGLYRPIQQLEIEQATDARRAPLAGVEMVLCWAMMVGYVAGLVVLRRRGTTVWPALGPAVAVAIAVVIAFASWRYRIAAEGVFVAVAIVALEAAIRHWDRDDRPVPTWLALGVALGAFAVLGAVGLWFGWSHEVARLV